MEMYHGVSAFGAVKNSKADEINLIFTIVCGIKLNETAVRRVVIELVWPLFSQFSFVYLVIDRFLHPMFA